MLHGRNKMNFILTGHKGLIGSFLLKKLIEQGHKPIALIDIRSEEDIRKIDSLKIDKKVDIMIHLAAFCKINKSISSPELPYEHNVHGTYRILEFCRKHKIPKILFTSSTRVLYPEKNPYTASKIYGEELVKAYSNSYGIEYIIIRPSTVYGPFNDFTKRLVDIYLLNLLQEKTLEIYGNENKTLDFTYVDDFVDGLLLTLDKKNKEYNISYGKGVKIKDVAEFLIKLHGKGTYKFLPPEIAQPQEVEVNISEINNLGYKPKVDVFQGLEICYNWYKSHLNEILESRKNSN